MSALLQLIYMNSVKVQGWCLHQTFIEILFETSAHIPAISWGTPVAGRQQLTAEKKQTQPPAAISCPCSTAAPAGTAEHLLQIEQETQNRLAAALQGLATIGKKLGTFQNCIADAKQSTLDRRGLSA